MPGEDRRTALEEAILVQLLYLNAKVQGLVMGVLAGLAIFIATNWLVLKGGDTVGPHLALLGQFFIGYRVSPIGSVIGFAYGFLTGYVVGHAGTTLYNTLARLRSRSAAPGSMQGQAEKRDPKMLRRPGSGS